MAEEETQERRYTKAEQQTRRARPTTKTIGEATRVFFNHKTPRIIGVLLIASLIARAFLGAPGWGDLLMVAAVAIYWPVQEWFAHKFILHLKPRKILGFTLDPYFAKRHRLHHQNPSDYELVFLPPIIPPVAFAIFMGVAWLVVGDWAPVISLMASLAGAALIYEWVHFMTHADYTPSSDYFRRIWRNHRLHHYKSEHHWFSFTVPSIDTWLGTGPDDHSSVEKSPTCRTLGFAVETDES